MYFSIPAPTENLERAVRVSRAVNRVRQMPTVCLANPLLAIFVALVFWERAPHDFLVITLSAMGMLLTPTYLSWRRLRGRPRPTDVSPGNERRAIIFSAFLGAIWGTLAWVLYPMGGADERTVLVILAVGLTGGSVSLFSPSPIASIAFLLPLMIPLFARIVMLDHSDHSVLPAAVAVFILATLFFMRSAWDQFVTTVRVLVERDEALAAAQASEQQLQLALSRMQGLAMVDELTGLKNRRAFFDDAEPAIAAARRRKQPVTVALMDLDFFKDINDTYGHAAGDLVLREVARRITGTLREEQIVGRFGGEEFVALLPDTTPAQALVAIERVRRAVGSALIAVPGGGPELRVTLSGGIAPLGEMEDLESGIDQADKAMYRAKGLGRDRVEVFGV